MQISALKAFQYYYQDKSRGRGQAEGILACGHTGSSGAPCCKKCAELVITKALGGVVWEYNTSQGIYEVTF